MATKTKTKSSDTETELRHADGCPGERTESWTTMTPSGDVVQVSRCLDCPAHTVEPEGR